MFARAQFGLGLGGGQCGFNDGFVDATGADQEPFGLGGAERNWAGRPNDQEAAVTEVRVGSNVRLAATPRIGKATPCGRMIRSNALP